MKMEEPARSTSTGTPSLSLSTAVHFVLCIHGLHGSPEDFSYLQSVIHLEHSRYGQIWCYSANSHTGKTSEGIEEGGTSLIKEVEGVISEAPCLKYISFVGFSLGGLYARYIVKELYDEVSQTICGLQPIDFVTIATPHLGVRRYTYFSLPKMVIAGVAYFMGKTGNQIFLLDTYDEEKQKKEPLLVSLTEDVYLRSLACFKRRRAYSILRKDFSVPLETAAIDPWIGSDAVLQSRLKTTPRKLFASTGEIVMVKEVEPQELEESPLISELERSRSSSIVTTVDEKDYEEEMAYRLNTLGWSKVIVDFPILFPTAHAQINVCGKGIAYSTTPTYTIACKELEGALNDSCDFVAAAANRRSVGAFSWRQRLNYGGRPIIDHVAQYMKFE